MSKDLPGVRRKRAAPISMIAPFGSAAQALQLLLQAARGGRGLLDKHHFRGAAGQRLQPEGTGSCEQIQAAVSVQGVLQPIEQCLPDAIRRRPQAREYPGKPRVGRAKCRR